MASYNEFDKKLCIQNLSDKYVDNDFQILRNLCDGFGEVIQFNSLQNDPTRNPIVFVEYLESDIANRAKNTLKNVYNIDAKNARSRNQPKTGTNQSKKPLQFSNLYSGNKSIAKSDADEKNEELGGKVLYKLNAASYEITIVKTASTNKCFICEKDAELKCKKCNNFFCSFECHHEIKSKVTSWSIPAAKKEDKISYVADSKSLEDANKDQLKTKENGVSIVAAKKIDLLQSASEIRAWKSHFILNNIDRKEKTYDAIVTFIDENNPTCTWVRLIENEIEYQNFDKNLNNFYETATNDETISAIAVEDCYVAKTTEKDKFMRVMVIELPKWMRKSVKIRKVDSGEEIDVPISSLRKATSEYKNKNAFALCIELKQGGPLELGKIYTIKLQAASTKKEITNVSIFLAELVIKDEKKNENESTLSKVEKEKIMENGNCQPKAEITLPNIIQEHNIFTIDDIKQIKLRIADDMDLLALDYSNIHKGFITVANNDPIVAKSYQKFMLDVNQYCKDVAINNVGNGYCPKLNELCLALFEDGNLWYRAECLEIRNSGEFNLHCIDFGNINVVSKLNIMPITEELCAVPCYAKLAAIENVNELSTKDKEEFVKSLQENSIVRTSRIKQMDVGYYSITIKK